MLVFFQRIFADSPQRRSRCRLHRLRKGPCPDGFHPPVPAYGRPRPRRRRSPRPGASGRDKIYGRAWYSGRCRYGDKHGRPCRRPVCPGLQARPVGFPRAGHRMAGHDVGQHPQRIYGLQAPEVPRQVPGADPFPLRRRGSAEPPHQGAYSGQDGGGAGQHYRRHAGRVDGQDGTRDAGRLSVWPECQEYAQQRERRISG